MSTISSGTTLTTALVQTGDTTGNLVIKTGSSNTTAMTISGSDQSVTFAGAINSTGSTLTNPTINGNVTTTGLNFDSNTLVVDATNNRVGVGTAVPSYPLDVSGNFRVASSSSNQTLINTGAYVSFLNTTNTSGFDIGLLGGASDAGAYIYQRANAPLIVATNNTERMRITSTGNVGIGVTNPGNKMAFPNNTYIGWRDSGGSNETIYIGASSSNILNIASSQGAGLGQITFTTGGSERMRIDSSGNVGIGCTPANRLSVKVGAAQLDVNTTASAVTLEAIDRAATGNSVDMGYYARNASHIFYNGAYSERFRFGPAGQLGIGGANYGTSGQVLVSQGSGAAPVWGSGSKIIQVLQTVKTDTFSASNTGDTAITGLSVSITPTSTSSKILVMYSVNYDSTRGNSGGGFRIYRGGTMLTGANGAVAGSRYTVNADFGSNSTADQAMMSRSFTYIDSPSSTSSLTYQIYQYQDSSGYTTYINRARNDANDTDDPRTASTITVMEIAG